MVVVELEATTHGSKTVNIRKNYHLLRLAESTLMCL